MTQRTRLLLGEAFLVLSLAALALRAHSGAGRASVPSEPVLVVVVEGAAERDAVRDAIDAERIVASSADGFAVREGRVVVSSLEAAGPLIQRAGWTDASFEIVKPGARPVAGAPAAGLDPLYSKPTLTLDEALRALQLSE